MTPRPLIIRFGALGDMVILTALIKALHQRFGQAVDVVTAGAWALPLLTGQPGVAHIYTVSSRRTPYWLSRDQQRLVRQLKQRGAGPTWLCEDHTSKIDFILQRAGWDEHDVSRVGDLPDLRVETFSERLRRFAYQDPQILGPVPAIYAGSQPACSELIVSATLSNETDQWLQAKGLPNRGFILVQAGNKRTTRRGRRARKSNSKYWPEENWATVLRGLRHAHPEHAILMLGVPPEAKLNDAILGLAAISNAFNIARENSVPRLMALAELALGMVSVDSGPAHVAAAVGCPTVVLFGVAHPHFYSPRGPQCRPSASPVNIRGSRPCWALLPWMY